MSGGTVHFLDNGHAPVPAAVGRIVEVSDDPEVHGVLVISFRGGVGKTDFFGDIDPQDLVYAIEHLKHLIFAAGDR